MYVHDYFEVKNNILHIGNIPATKLAQQYGTPLYVMDTNIIENNIRAYQRGLNTYLGETHLLYASKACLNTAIARLMAGQNVWLDCVSGGELYTAKQAGFPMENAVFHGNNKSMAELTEAIEMGVGRIVIDSLYEIDILQRVCDSHNVTQKVLIRVCPGVEAHTHAHIRTGQEDSKFGFNISDGSADAALQKVFGCKNLEMMGFHAHIGSQIMIEEPFADLAQVSVDWIYHCFWEYGYITREFDLGGGLGVCYVKGDVRPDYEGAVSRMLSAFTTALDAKDLTHPVVFVEPGRSLVAEAGVTLYRVGSRKEIENVRTYVSVDGGLFENLRTAMYDADYETCRASAVEGDEVETVRIAGKCCESGDIVVKETTGPKLKPGDLLAVFTTGAYHYSMSGNYNRFCRPAMVFVNGDKSALAVRRESYEDLIKNDLVPDWL